MFEYKILCLDSEQAVFCVPVEEFVAIFNREQAMPGGRTKQKLLCSTVMISRQDDGSQDIHEQHFFSMTLDADGYWQKQEQEKYMQKSLYDVLQWHPPLWNKSEEIKWKPTEEQLRQFESYLLDSE